MRIERLDGRRAAELLFQPLTANGAYAVRFELYPDFDQL